MTYTTAYSLGNRRRACDIREGARIALRPVDPAQLWDRATTRRESMPATVDRVVYGRRGRRLTYTFECTTALGTSVKTRAFYGVNSIPAAVTTHRIPMVHATEYRTEHYGVTFESAFVYRTTTSHSPTRIVVWSNTDRPNPRNGEPVRFGEYGRLDGGDGRYLDPHNRATDAAVSVLISTEATVITAQRDGTGHPNSGQVWASSGGRIARGDLLALVYPDGTEETRIVRFTNNGHGEADTFFPA